MKVLVVYNSLDPQSVAGVAIAKLRYTDVELMDIMGVTTGNITNLITALSAVYNLILINHTVTSAATGVISPAQQIALDAKTVRTVLVNSTASATAADNTLTKGSASWVINAYAGMWVKTTDHTGLNQERQIVTNSSTVLTLDSAWTVEIDNTTDFIISANREDFSYYVPATSGSNKRAWCAWYHETLFPNTEISLFLWKLAGDKTTNSVAVNALNVLDESYITKGAKYFLRDMTDETVISNWNKLLAQTTFLPVEARKTEQDHDLYDEMYRYGKSLVVSAAALTVTI